MQTRWLAVVGGVALGALALSVLPPCSAPLHAQAGCCKTRNAPGAAAWTKRPDLPFARCRDLNQERDRGDNIFEPTGLVWWDRACG